MLAALLASVSLSISPSWWRWARPQAQYYSKQAFHFWLGVYWHWSWGRQPRSAAPSACSTHRWTPTLSFSACRALTTFNRSALSSYYYPSAVFLTFSLLRWSGAWQYEILPAASDWFAWECWSCDEQPGTSPTSSQRLLSVSSEPSKSTAWAARRCRSASWH